MKIKRLTVVRLAVGFLTFAAPALAHHSWHGYDMKNLTTLKGTVTKFDWTNPHVWIRFDIKKDDAGKVEEWSAGGPSPSRMANGGWDKDTLKPGDQIMAVGNLINDGTHQMRLAKVVLMDGRELVCYGKR